MSCSSSAASAAWTSEIGKNLSYGDQRRLEVARALATQPKLLLLDEPTAGMNPQETLDFTAFVGRLRTERGLTVLLIEHDMRVVMGVSDRVTVLDYGKKIAEGTPQEIQVNERVIEAYLGAAAVSAEGEAAEQPVGEAGPSPPGGTRGRSRRRAGRDARPRRASRRSTARSRRSRASRSRCTRARS